MSENTSRIAALPPRLAEGLAALLPAAIRVASFYGSTINDAYARQVREAIDSGRAQLTVQVDLPSGDVRVMVDGPMFAGPTCLLALNAPSREPRRLSS